VIEHSH